MLSFGKISLAFIRFSMIIYHFFQNLEILHFLLIIVQFCTMILSAMGLSMIFKILKTRNFLPIFFLPLAITCLFLGILFDFHSYAEKGFKQSVR